MRTIHIIAWFNSDKFNLPFGMFKYKHMFDIYIALLILLAQRLIIRAFP